MSEATQYLKKFLMARRAILNDAQSLEMFEQTAIVLSDEDLTEGQVDDSLRAMGEIVKNRVDVDLVLVLEIFYFWVRENAK